MLSVVAVDTSILSAVEKHTSAWRHAGIALLMAIVAPAILGGVLFLVSVFDSNFDFHINASAKSVSVPEKKG